MVSLLSRQFFGNPASPDWLPAAASLFLADGGARLQRGGGRKLSLWLGPGSVQRTALPALPPPPPPSSCCISDVHVWRGRSLMSNFIFLMSARLSKHSAHTGRRIRGRLSRRKNLWDGWDFLFCVKLLCLFVEFFFFFRFLFKSLSSVIGFHPSSPLVNENSHLEPQQSCCLCGG